MANFTIETQNTSNPGIIKFEANKFLTNHQSFEYKNIDEAKDSPLAQQLFYLPFVKTVYISGNFIAIERYDIVSWPDVQEEVAEQILAYLNSGQPVIMETEKISGKIPVSIYAESTPNPAVMKFVANKKLVTHIYEFKNIDEANNSGLAQSLFHFPFVKEVFFDENYLSITKYDMADWNEVQLEVREHIRDYIASGKEIVSAEVLASHNGTESHGSIEQTRDEISLEIMGILEEYVKPAVASDGGNILFKSYDKERKTVEVILQGACSGCPSSTFTLKNGIETMLKNMMGGKVEQVVAING